MRKDGFELSTFSLPAPMASAMEVEAGAEAGVQRYRLWAWQGSEDPLHYCTITEVHSPAYLPLDRLRTLYPESHVGVLSPSVVQQLRNAPRLRQED